MSTIHALRSAQLITRLGFVVLLGFALNTCGAPPAPNNVSQLFVLAPEQLEMPSSYTLRRGRAEVLNNTDEMLTVRVYEGSLLQNVQLSIARISSEQAPAGVVGFAYLIAPESTRLLQPMRIALKLPVGVNNVDNLRLVRLDTGRAEYTLLEHQAYLPGPGLLAAEISSFGVVAIVDPTNLVISGNTDDYNDPFWRALHRLDYGEVDSALDDFNTAEQTTGTALAQTGVALMRLMTLFDMDEVQAFFSACGEPAWSTGALFGTDGYFEKVAARGVAESNLDLEVGFDAVNLVNNHVQPASIIAQIEDSARCVNTVAGASVGKGAYTIQLTDTDFSGGGRLELGFHLDPVAPLTNQSVTLQEMLAAQPESGAPLALDLFNGYIEVVRSDFVGSLGLESGSESTATLGDVGRYVPAAKNAGIVRLLEAGLSDGDAVRLVFEDAFFEPAWDQQPRQLLRLNGSIDVAVSAAPSTSNIPLIAGNRDIEDIIASCTMPVTENYLKGIAGAVFAELDGIAALLRQAAPSLAETPFRMPWALVRHPGEARVGPAEAHLLAGLLGTVSALGRWASGYRWFDGDLRDLLVNAPYNEEQCDDPCFDSENGIFDRTVVCQSVDRGSRLRFDLVLLKAAIESAGLAASTIQADPKMVHADLLTALDELQLATLGGAAGTLLGFGKPSVRPGMREVRRILGWVESALKAVDFTDEALPAAAIPTEDGFFFVAAAELFLSPPSMAVLRSSAEVDANAPFVARRAEGPSACNPGWSSVCVADCDANTVECEDVDDAACTDLPLPTAASMCTAENSELLLESWIPRGLFGLYVGDASCSTTTVCPAVPDVECVADSCQTSEEELNSNTFDAMFPDNAVTPLINFDTLAPLLVIFGQ